jgi:hypothetical protein
MAAFFRVLFAVFSRMFRASLAPAFSVSMAPVKNVSGYFPIRPRGRDGAEVLQKHLFFGAGKRSGWNRLSPKECGR